MEPGFSASLTQIKGSWYFEIIATANLTPSWARSADIAKCPSELGKRVSLLVISSGEGKRRHIVFQLLLCKPRARLPRWFRFHLNNWFIGMPNHNIQPPPKKKRMKRCFKVNNILLCYHFIHFQTDSQMRVALYNIYLPFVILSSMKRNNTYKH